MIVASYRRKCLKIVLVTIAMALLGGTAFAADKPAPASLPYSLDRFHETQDVTAPTLIIPANSNAWWTIFGDPKLDSLIAKAQVNNGDIALAAARLSQARAELRLAKVEQRPQASFGGNASRQTGPLINAAGGGGTLLSVGATIAYELDVLGRLSKTKKAARLDAEAADKLVQSARLMVAADVAQAYFELLTLDEEHALLRDAIAGEEQALRIVKARIANGFAAELEESRARGQLATVKSELSEVERRRAEVEHGLSFLLGDATQNLGIAGQRLDNPPTIPSDIPSVVLARRPDVAAADRKLAAATTRVGVAKTSWLPQLSLTTSRGYASSSLSTLLKTATQNFGLGFLLSLPFLDGGRRAAAIKRANADVELSAAEYRVQILTALREVEDQLSAVRILGEQADALGEAGAANAKAKAIIQSRFANGLISQLEMLEAGRTQLESARDAIRNKFSRYVATVGLVRALGGGWSHGNDKIKLGDVSPLVPSVQTASQ